jgi:alcohol dehydrogenase (cytochrome c)
MQRLGKLQISAAILLALGAMSAVAQTADYSPVTDARLVKPEAENWLMSRGNYEGWSYSPLDKINASNVSKMVPIWSYSTGANSGHQAPPIVNNGVMFVSTPSAQVLALNAKTGELLWKYKRELPEDFSALHNTNRGVALYGDKVYVTGLEPVVIALDAKTGKVEDLHRPRPWRARQRNLGEARHLEAGRRLRLDDRHL